MSNITNNSPVVTEEKLTEFYNDIKPFLGCPAYVTQEGDAEYYSTEEKVVGRWTDGKPLYQKTIIIQNAQANKDVYIDLYCDYFQMVITIKDQGDEYMSMPWILNQSFSMSCVKSSHQVYYRTTHTGSYIVTVQYTKTTDSASTTIEQKSTHYSTDEQVVGTWIDGKPVYQKTYISNTNFNRKTNVVIDTIANVDNVTNCFGYIINVLDDNRLFIGYSGGVNLSMLTTGALRIYSDGWDCKGYRVTIQYTKTTD